MVTVRLTAAVLLLSCSLVLVLFTPGSLLHPSFPPRSRGIGSTKDDVIYLCIDYVGKEGNFCHEQCNHFNNYF